MSRIDDIATRVLAAWYKLGQDTNYPPVQFDSFHSKRIKASSTLNNKPISSNIRGDHHKHIRAVGSASSVLLKNTANVLPLKNNIRVAILGSDAGPGDSTSNSHNCVDHGCSSGTIALGISAKGLRIVNFLGWGSGTANFPYIITPLEGIKNRAVKSGVSITSSLSDYDMKAATNLASSADVTLVFVSANSGEQYITVNGNAGDRTASGLNLWNNGDNLIYQAASASKNVVVVIHAPGPINMPWINHPSIVGIVYAGFPGQESGNGLADILFGDVNPSGRLPFSINEKIDDYSARVMTDYNLLNGLKAPQVDYVEGLFIDYRHNDAHNINPLFEFGYGLSYTNFVYENFALDFSSPDIVVVTFQVKNVGLVNGQEVVQLYLGFPEAAKEPPKLLRDFDKKMIESGQSVDFKLSIPKSEMEIWDTYSQSWISSRGTFQVYIGASSRDIKWRGSFSR
jgi:beta-glucosidase